MSPWRRWFITTPRVIVTHPRFSAYGMVVEQGVTKREECAPTPGHTGGVSRLRLILMKGFIMTVMAQRVFFSLKAHSDKVRSSPLGKK